jgi:hypothetical protein
MNDLKQISAPGFIEGGYPDSQVPLASRKSLARCQRGGCGHSTILGAAHKSSPRNLICRTWGASSHRASRTPAESTVRVKARLGPIPTSATARVMRTLGHRPLGPTHSGSANFHDIHAASRRPFSMSATGDIASESELARPGRVGDVGIDESHCWIGRHDEMCCLALRTCARSRPTPRPLLCPQGLLVVALRVGRCRAS